MAIAFVQSVNNVALSSTTVAVNITVTSGNLIVLSVGGGGFTTITGVSDGINTYTDNGDSLPGSTAYSHLWYTTASTSATLTITVTAAFSNNLSIIAQEFSGFTSPAKDKTKSASATSTAMDSGNTTTTTSANELVVGIGAWFNIATITIGDGFSNLDQTSNGTYGRFALESKVVSSTGAYNATLTLSSSTFWGMGVVTFKDTSEIASVSPVTISLSTPGVTATYVQQATASVDPISIVISQPLTTATHEYQYSATVSPLVIQSSLNTVTATYAGVWNAGVTPVSVTFSLSSVTASFIEVYSASISPVVIVSSLPSVTAMNTWHALVTPITLTLSIPVVTAKSYAPWNTGSVGTNNWSNSIVSSNNWTNGIINPQNWEDETETKTTNYTNTSINSNNWTDKS